LYDVGTSYAFIGSSLIHEASIVIIDKTINLADCLKIFTYFTYAYLD
jgi:hypothetical protein